MTMTPEIAQALVGHTPGPWRRSRMSNTAIEGSNGRGVCSTGGYSDNHSNGAYVDENIANADLVEAAPALRIAYLASEEENERLREELACTIVELIDHCGDGLDDHRQNRVSALRAATKIGGDA